jgi:hypothetical protein
MGVGPAEISEPAAQIDLQKDGESLPMFGTRAPRDDVRLRPVLEGKGERRPRTGTAVGDTPDGPVRLDGRGSPAGGRAPR